MNAKQFAKVSSSLHRASKLVRWGQSWKITGSVKGFKEGKGGEYTLHPWRADGAHKYNPEGVFIKRGSAENPIKGVRAKTLPKE